MNDPHWLAWVVTALFAVISVTLLMGKGSFIIAGYNTASKEKKAGYNEKRLCRVVGGGLSVVTVIVGIYTYYEGELPAAIEWLFPWGLFVPIAVILVLGNTICRVKK